MAAADRAGIARHTVGILCLANTVLLWTISNFLGSTILADNTYAQPFFVTYFNTASFIVLLPFIYVKQRYFSRRGKSANFKDESEEQAFLNQNGEHDGEHDNVADNPSQIQNAIQVPESRELDLRATVRLSFEFCLLWFAANWTIAACLQHTTVASSTILVSTSSVWTLIFGVFVKVERFSFKKLLGVAASFVGIILVSSIDFSGETDDNRGAFPHKEPREIALGDAMALGSAVLYGIYSVLMMKRAGKDVNVDMVLMFGLVGSINTLVLWPAIILLHFTGVEEFHLPPTSHVWNILLFNSATSLVADITWAYAIVYTSPLVVTVGLSLSIPLSIVGQIILNSQTSGGLYWIGAVIVVGSFILVNQESKAERLEPEGIVQPENSIVGGESERLAAG